MVPNDWEIAELSDLVEMKSGSTPSKADPENWNGIYPWISGKDLKTPQITSSIDKLTSKGFEISKKVPASTVLILVRGMMLLKTIPVGITTTEVAFNQDIKALVLLVEMNPAFLLYQLESQKRNLRDLVSTAGHGTGRLDSDQLKQFPMLIAPLPEQDKIAKILSTWDKAITITKELIENSKVQKKALMRALLVEEQSLKYHAHEWNEYSLEHILTERTERGNSKLPLLSITRSNGVVDQSSVGRKNSSSLVKDNYKLIRSGDIGYNTMRMWQGASALSLKDGVVSPAYTVLKVNPEVDALYLSYLFKLPSTIHEFYKRSQGLVSDTWNLKYRYLKTIRVRIPDYDEQKRIASLLLQSDALTRNLQVSLELLKSEKSSLLHQLLTGKRRTNFENVSG
ncbi:restriction endonuclease subunit S [Granulosicoccus sp.]|nr:restriction endonuclease subunit S [Granulosicoccus sp.]